MHLGVAISLRGGGLVAPAVHDADQLSLTDLMAALRDLTTRARGGRLRGSEMTDATITVTNLGDQGVRAVYGVIYPPQVALVGFGKRLGPGVGRRRRDRHSSRGHGNTRRPTTARPTAISAPDSSPTSFGGCNIQRSCDDARSGNGHA